MGRLYKKIVSYIVMTTLLFSLVGECGIIFAQENIDQGKCGIKVSYVIDTEGTLRISGSGEITNRNWSTFKDSIKKVVIENGVENIPMYAFSGYKNLEEVNISGSVNSIGSFAFSDCVALTDVNLDEGIAELGQSAMSGCTTLEDITIPNSVKNMGDSIFDGCTNLKNIQMPANIESAGQGMLDNTAFYNNMENWEGGILYCGNVLIKATGDAGGMINIKSGTKVIAPYAFQTTTVTSVVFPKGLVNIGHCAFYNCKSLSSTQFASGLKFIGNSAFYGNDLLKIVNLPDTLEEIGNSSFSSCVRLEQVNLPDNLKKIGEKAFYNCNSLENLKIPSQVISIGNDFLEGCTSLIALYAYTEQYSSSRLPDNLETIYGYKGSYYETYANSNGITFVELTKDAVNITECEQGKIITTDETITGKDYRAGYDKGSIRYVDYANKSINAYVSAAGCGYNSPYSYENLIDGNNSNYWQISGVKEIYVAINMGTNISFNDITIAWMELPPSEYQISISSDGRIYEQIIEVCSAKGMRTDEIEFEDLYTAKFIKISFNVENSKAQYNHSIREISVYGVEGQMLYNDEATTELTTAVSGQLGNGEKETIDEKRENVQTTTIERTEEKAATAETVQIKSIKEKNYHTAVIRWNGVKTNYKYEVYRTTEKRGEYKKIAAVWNNSYSDRKVKAGQQYFYKIKAISGDVTSISNTKKIIVKGHPNKPALKVTASSKFLKIKWGILNDNSVGIQIYVKSKQGGYAKYTKIHETTKLKKTKKKKGVTGIESAVTGLKKDVVYYFRARTYAKIKGKKIYSKWSNTKKIMIK